MDIDLTPLKAFATSRPVMYGATAAAALGVALGLMFQVGSQTAPTRYAQAPSQVHAEEETNPITWPSGKVPDYVIGTDFLAEARPRHDASAIYAEDDYVDQYVPASTPAAETTPPPVAIAARPAREETRWASTDGDILNVRLPDDPAEDDAPVEAALLN